MKNITQKSASVLLLLCTTISSFATEIYLSPTGDDNNDGSTPEWAVKTLQTAYNLIPANNNAGHIIHVSGFIDISMEAEAPVNMTNGNQSIAGTNDGKKYLTVDGNDSATSGFDGKSAVALINLAGNSGTITFKNLTFKNGNANQGAALNIVNGNGTFLFENCKFQNNTNATSNTNSGNIHIFRTNVTFDSCEFQNNTGGRGGVFWMFTDAVCTIKNSWFHNNSAVNSGGAIYQNGNAKTAIENCIFEENSANGYVIENNSTEPFSLLHSKIQNNAARGLYSSNVAGALNIRDCVIKGNVTSTANTDGGGIRTVNATNYIERSAIIGNAVARNGGGIYLTLPNGNASFQMINSTIAGNTIGNSGAAVYVDGAENVGNELLFLNVTVTGNLTAQNNYDYSAFRIYTNGNFQNHLWIYNSIFENNLGNNGSGSSFDIRIRSGKDAAKTPEEQGKFLIKNSIIQVLYGDNNTVTGTSIIDPATDVANSAVGGRSFGIAGQPYVAAGLATPYAGFLDSQNSIPLEVASNGVDFGDAQYLQALDIHTDQLGNIRSFTDGKCAVGAVEVPAVTALDPHDYQHFIIYGQSLSVGYQAYQSLSTTNVPGNYMIGDQVWYNYGNPTASLNQLNPLAATSAKTSAAIAECPIIAAVNHIRLQQDIDHPETVHRFIATSAGIGGKSVAQLSKDHTEGHYKIYEATLKAAYGIAARSGSTIHCPAIFWMQGENDYTSDPVTPNNDYKTALIQLKNDMQADVKTKYGQTENPLFITYQVGAQYTRGQLQAGMAQLEASNEYADVICAGPIYPVTDVGGHIDANGSRWYGEMLGKAYYQTKILGQKFKPLQPIQITVSNSDDKQVVIQYYVPVKPLVLDTLTLRKVTDYGFEVYNNNLRQSITKVEITGEDEVTLTCAASLTGNVNVAYAGVNVTNAVGGGNGRGHGNLRDSDTAKGFGHYIHPELKTDGENFDYPHYPDANQTTFIPASGEPLDPATQLPIYDQPYPLYNFSVAFYLEADKLTSIATTREKENIQIYSAKGILYVKSQGNANVALLDMSGKTVDRFSSEKRYDLSHLQSGVYIVRIQSDNGVKSGKIIL